MANIKIYGKLVNDTAEGKIVDYAQVNGAPDPNTLQDKLVSGTNIKTINNTSVLGEGNITIEGESIDVVQETGSNTDKVMSQKAVTDSFASKSYEGTLDVLLQDEVESNIIKNHDIIFYVDDSASKLVDFPFFQSLNTGGKDIVPDGVHTKNKLTLGKIDLEVDIEKINKLTGTIVVSHDGIEDTSDFNESDFTDNKYTHHILAPVPIPRNAIVTVQILLRIGEQDFKYTYKKTFDFQPPEILILSNDHILDETLVTPSYMYSYHVDDYYDIFNIKELTFSVQFSPKTFNNLAIFVRKKDAQSVDWLNPYIHTLSGDLINLKVAERAYVADYLPSYYYYDDLEYVCFVPQKEPIIQDDSRNGFNEVFKLGFDGNYMGDSISYMTSTDRVYHPDNNSNLTSSLDYLFNHKYEKPSGGVPKTDLATSVQSTLDSVSNKYEKPSGGIPEEDIKQTEVVKFEENLDYQDPQISDFSVDYRHIDDQAAIKVLPSLSIESYDVSALPHNHVTTIRFRPDDGFTLTYDPNKIKFINNTLPSFTNGEEYLLAIYDGIAVISLLNEIPIQS